MLLPVLSAPLNAQSPEIWIAGPQVIEADAEMSRVSGVVFDDANRNGVLDEGESGVPGVLVTNGREWTRTDAGGRYELSVYDDMNLSIVQPSGWRVPTDTRMVPQFFYVHKAGGTGYEMRFGGLPDTGMMPAEVHFPLSRAGASENDFACAVIGDTQAYSNEQVGWLRDGVLADIIRADFSTGDCMIYLGDVVGDDLGLLDRILSIGATAGLPQWMVIGNHDIDFDARSNADKADTWRRIYGPEYYAFEQGNVLFVMLDNVVYPCGEADVALGRDHCADEDRKDYNGRLTEHQFQWLKTLVEKTPEDRLIVLNAHIPFVSFVDAGSKKHQNDEADRLYDMLEGREVLTLTGHTHTIENHAPGQLFEGWTESVGAGPLPFRHIVAGAASGAWFQGDFNMDGIPMALQRMGAPMGYVHLAFEGTDYRERYIGAGLGEARGQWVGVNTPAFRNWFDPIIYWMREDADSRNPVPPLSINDLPDPRIVTPEDFEQGIYLTANVWIGDDETEVTATLPGGQELVMQRTQQGDGEPARTGAEWADPFAVARQLSVARYALQSDSGNPRAQGFELFSGRSFGPAAPQPQSSVADRNMHLWRVGLPSLPLGVHHIRIESTLRHGARYEDHITLEVKEERPAKYWRNELWD